MPSPPASCIPTGRSSTSRATPAIGFSGMEMETLVRYKLPAKIVVLNNGGIGPGMPEIPDNPMFNLKPNALIYGARYDRVMEAFGGKGFFVEDPKDLRGALDEAMNFRGPALVNVVISQGSARKPQQFRWHSWNLEIEGAAPASGAALPGAPKLDTALKLIDELPERTRRA